jgi:hypothetical protein
LRYGLDPVPLEVLIVSNKQPKEPDWAVMLVVVLLVLFGAAGFFFPPITMACWLFAWVLYKSQTS